MADNGQIENRDTRKYYTVNDMVKVGCHDCAGCSLCCEGMGQSIILNPFDLYQIIRHENTSFEALMQEHIELHVEDGCILPNLKMVANQKETQEQCTYLNAEGRCSIHEYRPGLCRIFPLGRNYAESGLTYFLLEEECPKENKTKVKVSKWIDTPQLKRNQEFLMAWHSFLKEIRHMLSDNQDEEFSKNSNLYVLNQFYIRPYQMDEDFYPQFMQRLEEARESLGL